MERIHQFLLPSNRNSVFIDLLLLFFFCSLTVGVLLFILPHGQLRLFSDYDEHLPMYQFLYEKLHQRTFPTTNPYIATGVPVLGDPLTSYFNPVIFVSLLFFPPQQATLLQFFLATFLAMAGMWGTVTLLRYPRWIALWAGGMAGFAGSMPAAFTAGHIEKWFVPSVMPVFFLILTKEKWKKWEFFVAVGILSLLYWGDSTYFFFFSVLFFLLSRVVFFSVYKEKKHQIILGVCLLFSVGIIIAPKLIAFLTTIVPIYERSVVDPTRGSLLFPMSLIPFLMPFTTFYERPKIQWFFGLYYNWYEYFAFITPIPFLFLWGLRSRLKKSQTVLLVSFAILGFSYVANRYPISPFYWLYRLFPFFQNFRTPQRMNIPLTTVLLLLSVVGLQSLFQYASFFWKRVLVILAILAVVTTSGLALFIESQVFEKSDADREHLVQYLRQSDSSSYYVLLLTCCMQVPLIKNHIPILNYYHGWRVKKVSALYPDKIRETNYVALDSIRPRYIIDDIDNKQSLVKWGYVLVRQENKVRLWKTLEETIMPILNQ